MAACGSYATTQTLRFFPIGSIESTRKTAYNRVSVQMSRYTLMLALVVAYAATVRLISLNRPFDYDPEGSASLNGVLARSYLRFDWSQSHGMPILSLDPGRAAEIVFYPDHPPLVPLLIAPFYKAFGIGEWQTRLPIALTTIGVILALYQLLVWAASPRLALIAAAVFASTPMAVYFGGFADVVGMPLVLAALLSIFGYLRFQDAPDFRTFVLFLAAFVAAALCDWPAYVLVPVFVGHFIATRPRHDWVWALAFGLAACVLFGGVYTYVTLATHSPWNWMADLFARRSALVGSHSYSWRQWISIATRTNSRYHTAPLMAAAAAWIAAFGFRRRAHGGATVARLLLVWATLYVLIGAKALFDHEWAWSVLTPALAVGAALLLERLPGAGVAVVVVAFAAWTTHAGLTSLYPPERDRPFTPMQMAQALEIAAPHPWDVALLVGSEDEAQLWFYGDRPLRSGIWSVEDFQRRLDDDTVDLMFNFDEQPWKARATGIVFPKIWVRLFASLHSYLEERFPLVPLPPTLADHFDVFDLGRSCRSSEQGAQRSVKCDEP